MGAYWGASRRDQASKSSRGGLFGRLMSQINGWDEFHSVQTSYPPQTAQHVIVQPGDTLQGIAEEYYGSTDGATLIALNNGFMPGSDAQIVPGQNLDLPEYRPMTNNSSNSIAYWQFMDLMSARLTPFVQLPPEETPLLEIFVGIVAVVVAIAVESELSAEILGVAVTALTTVADMALVSAVAAGTAGLIDAAG